MLLPHEVQAIRKLVQSRVQRVDITMSNEEILKKTTFNMALQEVDELLEGVENGTIDRKTIEAMLKD